MDSDNIDERNAVKDYFGTDLEDLSHAVNYMHWVLDAFRPYLGRTVIEVGAGMGGFSKTVIDGIDPDVFIACEPAPNMFKSLEANLRGARNAVTVKGFLKDAVSLLPHSPDTILYVNVLEHIFHDRRELALAHESLAGDGHVCILVPAHQFLYSRLDKLVGHHRRYSKRELVDAAESAGFRTLKCYYIDFFGIIGWWVLFRLLKQERPDAGRVSFYDRTLVPLMRKMFGTENRFIGKNLVLIGRKA